MTLINPTDFAFDYFTFISNGGGGSRDIGDLAPVLDLVNQGAGTVVSPDFPNLNNKALAAFIDATAFSDSGTSVTVTISARDNSSGQYFDILSSPSINTVTSTLVRLLICPGVAALPNAAISEPLPAIWRVKAVVSGTGNVSLTCGAHVM